jgi:cobalt-zinc-cadmium resistance protein CzcA
MLRAIIAFALTQRLLIGLVTLLVAILGVLAWERLPVDAFPDIAPTQVKVILKVPGMTAEEIEQSVTYPLETELLGIPRKTILRSTTKYAITDVTLDFEEGVDIYWARQQVAERLATLADTFPPNTRGGLAPMSTPLSEMFMFTLEHPRLDLMERRDLLDWVIRPALRTVPGVADVNVLGGEARSLRITPDPERMARVGISREELRAALASNNRNVGVGRLEQGVDALIVRVEARIETLAELRDLAVAERAGRIVRLRDVATVVTDHLTRYGAVTRDGAETTEGLVVALRGVDTGAVVAGVKARLAEIQSSLPAGTEINVFYDRAQLIDGAIHTMSMALVQAVALVVVLLALFLGNLRAAAVVSLSLPMAALATFLLMKLTGVTANLMSLGGLVIAIGMLVDASVVVVENVLTHLDEERALPRLHSVYRAVCEVAQPVVAGSVIVILVFAPLLTLQGLEGKLFSPVALTIVFAMLAALVFALVVVPLLAGLLLLQSRSALPAFMRIGQQRYAAILRRILERPAPALILALVVLASSAVVATQIGRIFMPVMDEGDVIVQTEKSPGISLDASIDIDRQVERALLEAVPEILQVVARTGSDELGLDPMGLNETDIFMQLAPVSSWRPGGKEALVDAIREVMDGFPGMSVGFTQPIQMRVSEMLTGSTGDVTIKLFGDNLGQLAALSEDLAREIAAIDGAQDLQRSLAESDAFLNVRPDAVLATATGLSGEALASRLLGVFEGEAVSLLREGRRRIPIVLGTDHTERPASVEGLGAARLRSGTGEVVTLGSVAALSEEPGPVLIQREQGSRYAALSVNVEGRDIVGFVDEARTRLASQLTLPPGYRIEFGGEFENQQRATARLMLLVPVVLGLIVLILFATFRSMAVAALIILNVPFALMGGLVALYASGEYLSVPASVGLIALLGIAVLNSVVMVSNFEQLRVRVADRMRFVVDGSVQRLRPVLMTATTAMFGLLPLVFATGPGAELQRPLAIVVIGGLVTSTLTTLFLLPVFYKRFDEWRS